MKDEKRAFGELELAIMNVIWDKKEVTVLDVQNSLGKDNAYTTIMTVLSRMFNKGMVERIKNGRNYIYTITKEKPLEITNILDKIKKSIFDGNAFQMVNYLIDNSNDINKEELESIEALIDKRKKELGTGGA